MDAGLRLREERDRIRLTQTELATLAGVTRSAQGNYESGARVPDAAYLMRAAAAGVDVLYVLTGRRAPVPGGEEEALLARYRAAPPALREAVLRVLGMEAAPGAGPGSVASFGGDNLGNVAHTQVIDSLHFGGEGPKKSGRR
jgi:transcriptional regulator with XRE-family HTH domain